jgi:hypothetical protein
LQPAHTAATRSALALAAVKKQVLDLFPCVRLLQALLLLLLWGAASSQHVLLV